MGAELPDALDMLNLCVECGLSFQAALAQVADEPEGCGRSGVPGLQEMQLGVPRARRRGDGGRTQQEDLQRFVSAILQVDKLGIPVAAVLREQAREMRAKRFSRAREQAQKVPVKILMPLMLCFLPGLFIIILGPAVSPAAARSSRSNLAEGHGIASSRDTSSCSKARASMNGSKGSAIFRLARRQHQHEPHDRSEREAEESPHADTDHDIHPASRPPAPRA